MEPLQSARQHSRQRHAGVRAQFDHVFRCGGGYHAASAIAAFGAEVQHPVGFGDHIEVVLNDHYAVAAVDQAAQTDKAFQPREGKYRLLKEPSTDVETLGTPAVMPCLGDHHQKRFSQEGLAVHEVWRAHNYPAASLSHRFSRPPVDALINLKVGGRLCRQILIWLDRNTFNRLRIAVVPQRWPARRHERAPMSALEQADRKPLRLLSAFKSRSGSGIKCPLLAETIRFRTIPQGTNASQKKYSRAPPRHLTQSSSATPKARSFFANESLRLSALADVSTAA